MASFDQLKALIKSHISRDDGQFLSVAMQLAAHEAKLGHGKLAEAQITKHSSSHAGSTPRSAPTSCSDEHTSKAQAFGQCLLFRFAH